MLPPTSRAQREIHIESRDDEAGKKHQGGHARDSCELRGGRVRLHIVVSRRRWLIGRGPVLDAHVLLLRGASVRAVVAEAVRRSAA